MKFVNKALALLFFYCFLQTDAWFSRRRRRRACSPSDCEVSSWSSWSSCSAEKCGQQGSQRRTREQVSEPSCGGSECPTLEETRQCYSTQTVNCQLSSWSAWTACSTVCGVSGIQTITRHRVITEQCGGTCSSTLRKTRACPELSCLNGGSLQQGACFCNKGYSGVCCQKKLKKGLSGGGIVGIVCACCMVPVCIGIGIYCTKKNNNNNNRIDVTTHVTVNNQ